MRFWILTVLAAVLYTGCAENGQSYPVPSMDAPTPQAIIKETPRYREEFSGRGENENGKPFSFHTYVGPDGQKISTKFEKYESDGSEIENRFDQIIKTSGKVLDRREIVDDMGKPVGKEAWIDNANSSASESSLVVVTGSRLYVIEAATIDDLRDFRQDFIPRMLRMR
jgi:hypothetical protein